MEHFFWVLKKFIDLLLPYCIKKVFPKLCIKPEKNLYVKRIKTNNDPDFELFIGFYETIFRQYANSWDWDNAGSFHRWLHKYDKNLFLYIAKDGYDQVIAFYCFQYFDQSKSLFLGYLGKVLGVVEGGTAPGMTKDHRANGRAIMARDMYKSVFKLLKNELQGCKHIIYEIDNPKFYCDRLDYARCKAAQLRIRAFNRDLQFFINESRDKLRGRFPRAYQVTLPYYIPKINFEDEINFSKEDFCNGILYFIDLDSMRRRDTLPKEDLKAMLKSIYLDSYGVTYDGTNKEVAYKAYINEVYEEMNRLVNGIDGDCVTLKIIYEFQPN